MRKALLLLAAVLLTGCESGIAGPAAASTGPAPGCNPVVAVSPTSLTLSSGGSATVAASVSPCGLAKKTSWTVTDPSVATVAPTNDTSAVVTGARAGTTTIVVSLTAFAPANTVVVVQVQ